MECAKCGSYQVDRLPPSQITPHPGYRCGDCGLKMRAPGMLPLYLLVIVLGGGFAALVIYLALGGEGDKQMPAKGIWFAGVGIFCVGYALMQIARPVPRRGHRIDPPK